MHLSSATGAPTRSKLEIAAHRAWVSIHSWWQGDCHSDRAETFQSISNFMFSRKMVYPSLKKNTRMESVLGHCTEECLKYVRLLLVKSENYAMCDLADWEELGLGEEPCAYAAPASWTSANFAAINLTVNLHMALREQREIQIQLIFTYLLFWLERTEHWTSQTLYS